MTKEPLSKISNILFTSREIDVISCIVHLKGAKKIADILDISYRTVEGYIQNILTKTSSSSQERIKDFVESSEQLSLIKERYIELLINKLFLVKISNLSKKLKNRNISCVVNFKPNKKLEYVLNCLKLSSIDIIKKSDIKYDTHPKIIEVLNDNQLSKIKSVDNFNNIVFLNFDSRINDTFLNKFSNVKVVDCSDDDNLHIAIFKIIELLAPGIDLNESISSFCTEKNNIINLKTDLTAGTLSIKQYTKENKLNKKVFIVIYLIAISVIGIVFIFIYKENRNVVQPTKLSINFLLPHEKILLHRKEFNEYLDKIFEKPNVLKTAILVGQGGSGKTTIARYYANRQKASIIWEINAETKNSLSSSFESLAYALCYHNECKQELRSILDSKDFETKNKLLLLFVQKQLKAEPNWLLIYDNLESLSEIYEFLPQHFSLWGNGKVIITTRDSTIKNNNYIDAINIINVPEINPQQKLELFRKITADLPNPQFHDKILTEDFLSQIPSFPLDVSIAGHYLRDTGIMYNNYLEEIVTTNREFSELQSLILNDVNQYTKTRFSIVSLTLQKMIKSNSAFYDLALFISLLDSEDIPEELLVSYKDQYIIISFLRSLKKNSLITNMRYKSQQQENIENLTSFSIHRSTQSNILASMIEFSTVEQREELLHKILNTIQSYILQQIDLENAVGLKNLINHCLALISKKNLMGTENLVSINNSLGIIYYYLGNDEAAKDLLEKNLTKSVNEETALVLTHLGAIYRKIGKDYGQAVRYLQQAIAIYDKLSPNSQEKALALTHLGNTYRTLGYLTKAEEELTKSVNIYCSQHTNNVGEARSLGYLGVVYREQGNFSMAKQLLEQAKNIYIKEKFPKYSSVYAGTIGHLGITYRLIGDYQFAKQYLEESLEIYKIIRPKDHPDTGRNILNLGIIYCETNNLIKAESMLVKSLNDYEKNYGKDHIETGKVLNHLGRFYTLSHKFLEAEQALRRALLILDSSVHPETYRSFELLGDLYNISLNTNIISNKDKVIDLYEKSLSLAIKSFPEESINVQRIKSKIAQSFE